MEGYLFLTAANILSILKWFKGASYEGALGVVLGLGVCNAVGRIWKLTWKSVLIEVYPKFIVL